MKWLKSLELKGLDRETLSEYLLTYKYLAEKIERLDNRIEELASGEKYTEKVQNMGCFLGIKTHTALSMVVTGNLRGNDSIRASFGRRTGAKPILIRWGEFSSIIHKQHMGGRGKTECDGDFLPQNRRLAVYGERLVLFRLGYTAHGRDILQWTVRKFLLLETGEKNEPEQNPEEEAKRIPADEFENLMCEYLPIAVEQLRSYAAYDKENIP